MSSSSSSSSPPPWEALQILGPYIDDPKTLATASCVSSSWRAAFSGDHLWARICSSSYPSLSALHLHGNPSSRPRALFSALRSAKRRRLRGPPKPRLALRDLIFTLDVYRCSGGDGESLLSFAKPGDELALKSGGIFLFEVDLTAGGNAAAAVNCREEMKVVWTAVKVGCACDVGGDVGAFSMMECAAKGRAVGGSGLWFAEKLPGPPCCSSIAAEVGGAEAEVGMGLGGGDGENRVVERVSLGLLSGASCRYVGLDDGLLYLQHFLF
ncbi:probable F-box protein At5g04010 [Ananas comosus]|uniref:Probable F-box protein At5g04010 n=1 Tax=Ananas comosus TaxID=4615 RepID=A0A6P5HIH0_ANACO|nr:probable F-box protein At5g04010 [Ananas comosus]